MIEFAFIVPILVALVLAGVEFTRFVNINQRIDRTANTVGDFAARSNVLTPTDLDTYYAAAQHVASPYDLAGQGLVILSSVEGDDTNGPQVLWQRNIGGALSVSSHIGAEGSNATLPAGLTVDEGATNLVTEVFFDFQPTFFVEMFSPTEVYYRAFHRPRKTNMLTLAP